MSQLDDELRPGRLPGVVRAVPWVLLFIASAVVLATFVQPFRAGAVAFDGTASVLYFERIVAGQRLETFVNTTPKPLLTIVFGLAHGLTGDWRLVTWSTILVMSAAVTLGSRLALRVGGIVAAAAAAVVLLLTPPVIIETAWSHGMPWALACWFGVGLALTRPRPSYGLAGVLLMLGCLARQETFLLLGVATVVLAFLALRHRVPSGAWWLLIGWAALPAMALHDWRLTGDPLWSFKVASINAVDTDPRSVDTVLGMVGDVFASLPLVTLAAVIGVLAAWRTAAGRIVAVGIATIAVGTPVLLVLLSALGRQTLYYYLHPVSVALGFGAALGVAVAISSGAALARRMRRRAGIRRPRRAVHFSSAVAAIVLIVVVIGPALSAPDLRDRWGAAARSDAAAQVLRSLLPSSIAIPEAPGPTGWPNGAGFRVLVPHEDQARLAVDLGLPLTVIGWTAPDRHTQGSIHPGLIVFYDPSLDSRGSVPRAVLGTSPATEAGVTFERVWTGEDGTSIWRSND